MGMAIVDVKYSLITNMVLNWILIEYVLMTSILPTLICHIVIVPLLDNGLFLDYVLFMIVPISPPLSSRGASY